MMMMRIDDDDRYQKALEAGCIPVVVSDKVTLPFESLQDPLLVNWSDAVIR
jgi:ABC-type amino acid transport substrate-binding protein